MRGDWFVQRQEPDRGFALSVVLAVEGLEDLIDGLCGAQELVEVRGDWFAERQEPDRRFVLFVVVFVEGLEHLVGRFGGAEDLVEHGRGLFVQRKFCEGLAGAVAGAGEFEHGGDVDGREWWGELACFQFRQ